MKENGYNAIRTSHNPPSSDFLNACDELGMLVIDEAFDHWVKPKRPNDYSNYFEVWHKSGYPVHGLQGPEPSQRGDVEYWK